MRQFDVMIKAQCPERKRGPWEGARALGYTVSFFGEKVCLVGKGKTTEELQRIDHLVWSYPDHHISLRESPSKTPP